MKQVLPRLGRSANVLPRQFAEREEYRLMLFAQWLRTDLLFLFCQGRLLILGQRPEADEKVEPLLRRLMAIDALVKHQLVYDSTHG